jgi:hypothetical protein
MHTSSSATDDGTIPKLEEALGRPTRDPPNGRADGSAAVTLRQVLDHDRIVEGMNGSVVPRLFSAGLSLERALGLMGDHPAAGEVRDAIGELGRAIRDFRNVLLDHHQPDSPNGGQSLRGESPCL